MNEIVFLHKNAKIRRYLIKVMIIRSTRYYHDDNDESVKREKSMLIIHCTVWWGFKSNNINDAKMLII